jgi:hypothetical protein
MNNLFYTNASERDWACYQMNREANIDNGGNLQYPQERFNQSGTPDDCRVTPSVIIADPQPQNLADNGGPTMTVALPEGSPAINAGSNTGAPSTDQRGYPRDEQCDIGAYEYTSQGNIDFPGLTTVWPLLLLDD